MFPDLIDLLCCPACHGALDWTIYTQTAIHIEQAEARCTGCALAYAVTDGIAVLRLPDEGQPDLWAEVDNGIAAWLSEHADVAQALLHGLQNALAPTDLFIRGQLLEQGGEILEGRRLQGEAEDVLYTPAYLAARQAQIELVVTACETRLDPIVDLASGLGALVEALLRHTPRQVVATDYSPLVLRRDRAYFRQLGYDDRISYIACDARHAPFRAGALQTLTSFVGLANIEQPGALLAELRRIVSGQLLAVHHLFADNGDANAALIRQYGLETLLFEQPLLDALALAGWQAAVTNRTPARALPTPESALIPGLRLDGLPAVETVMDWCVLTGA